MCSYRGQELKVGPRSNLHLVLELGDRYLDVLSVFVSEGLMEPMLSLQLPMWLMMALKSCSGLHLPKCCCLWIWFIGFFSSE